MSFDRRKFLKIATNVAGVGLANHVLASNSSADFFLANLNDNSIGVSKENLRCAFIKSPLGIDDVQPSLTWFINDSRRNVLQSSYRILVATNPQILAANNGDLWDSGEVFSQDCNLIKYNGIQLQSMQQCYWKVFIKATANGKVESAWSDVGMWEMGLLQPKDWKGSWIQSEINKPVDNEATQLWGKMTLIPHKYNNFKNNQLLAASAYKKGQEMVNNVLPAPIFKTSFNAANTIKKARLYICGAGFQEAFINGLPVSNRMHDTSVTHYPERGGYATHDVTNLIKQGNNVIAVTVGSGWFHEVLVWGNPNKIFGRPGLMAQLEIEYTNGKQLTIATNNKWQTAVGPIIKSDYYAGELYDARKADIENKDIVWTNATEIAPLIPKLTAQKCEPERVVRRVKPVDITEPRKGVYVVDLGELIVGTIELNVKASNGTPVIMRTAEVVWGEKNEGKNFKADLLHFDDFENDKPIKGMIASKARGGAYFTYGFKADMMDKAIPSFHLGCPTIVYIAKGSTNGERYRPSFTIHAFRYIEIQGLNAKPTLDIVTGLVITNDSDTIGSFTCGNKDFNDIWEASINSTRYNTHGMSWDNCVERLQSQVYNAWSAPFISYILHSPNLWKKILADQRLQNVLTPGSEKFTGTIYGKRFFAVPAMYPVTQGVTVELPMELYMRYGDKQELENHYPHMKTWCKAMFPANDGVIASIATMAAWNDHFYAEASDDCVWRPELNQPAFMSMMMYKNIMDTMKVAQVLNKTNDVVELENLAGKIKKLVNDNWYNATNKTYGSAKNKKTQQVDDSTGWHGMMALAITCDIAPKDDVPMIVLNCIKDMKEKYNNHHAAGHITHQLLYDVYSNNGLIETCYDMMNANSYPSFKWILAQSGSHTISEGPTSEDMLPSKTTVAQNECQEPARWFTQTLCGISPDFNEPAFKHIFLQPQFPKKLPSASLKTITAYGKLESSWVQKNNTINWKVVIPANSYATAILPVAFDNLKENNALLEKIEGCKILNKNGASVQFVLGSGTYNFTFPSPQNKPSLLSKLT